MLFVACLTAGCGTSPTPLHEAREVPPARVFERPVVKSTNPAQVMIVRDKGLHGAEHVFTIFVNGRQTAELRQGEKVTISADPGTVFIEARMANIINRVPPVQVETVLQEGKTYTYRVGLDEATLRMLRDLSASN